MLLEEPAHRFRRIDGLQELDVTDACRQNRVPETELCGLSPTVHLQPEEGREPLDRGIEVVDDDRQRLISRPPKDQGKRPAAWALGGQPQDPGTGPTPLISRALPRATLTRMAAAPGPGSWSRSARPVTPSSPWSR